LGQEEGDTEGEEEAEERERRVRKRFLEAELDNPNSTLDINENSPEWDDL
jgi:hypothetical protein